MSASREMHRRGSQSCRWAASVDKAGIVDVETSGPMVAELEVEWAAGLDKRDGPLGVNNRRVVLPLLR